MRLIDADVLIKTIRENDYLVVDYFNSKDRGMFTSGILQAIDEQPSVQPEPQWIPCSERLPDMGFSVLVTAIQNNFVYVAEAVMEMDGTWSQMRWSASLKANEVIAWMPLPEPYKGDE